MLIVCLRFRVGNTLLQMTAASVMALGRISVQVDVAEAAEHETATCT